jgi:hypothetical protein
MRVLLIAIVLAACAASPPDEPLAVPPLPPEAAAECPAPTMVPTASTPASVATRDYRKAEAQIGPAITNQDATAADIYGIGRADKAAQSALRLLVSEDGKPTQKSIAAARMSLDNLIAALEASGGSH